MARLLLSSFGFDSPLVREKLARVIPQDSLRDKTCLVIPDAGLDSEKTFEREKQALIDFGFCPERILWAKNGVTIALHSPDYLYVPGGNPFKLLRAMRDNRMMEVIRECVNQRGTVYIGASAGADVATPDIRCVTQLEDNEEIDENRFEALGLIKESVLCHREHYGYATVRVYQEMSDRRLIAISDTQLVQYQDENWDYVGEEV